MYIERLPGLPHGDWVRTSIGLPLRRAREGNQFQSALRELAGITIAELDPALSFRLLYEPPATFRRSITLLTPMALEDRLRRVAGLFSRLELIEEDSVEFPRNEKGFDEIGGAFPRWRAIAPPAAQGDGNPWFLPHFDVFPYLDRLVMAAQFQDSRFGYQCNLRPRPICAGLARQLSRNLLKVEAVNGVPSALVESQRAMERQFRNATYCAEEFVGVSSIGAARSLERELNGAFDATHRSLHFGAGDFVFQEEGFDDWVSSGFHHSAVIPSGAPQAWMEACLAERVTETIGWTPNKTLSSLLPASPVKLAESGGLEPVLAAKEPAPGAAYAFVSYAHSDREPVSRLLQTMEDAGMAYWYDQHIPGAADWNETLEERISRCAFLVLMLTPRAVDSKYVRREVAFADSLDKPILTVQLEPAELRRGLRFRLSSYQMIEARPEARVLEQMRRLMGTTEITRA